MSDFDDDVFELDEPVVVMTDEEGNEYHYIEEEVISIGEKRFAILVPLDATCDCGDDCDEDACGGDAVIAKIENVDGEDVYSNPTDEEFEEVLRLYEEREDFEE